MANQKRKPTGLAAPVNASIELGEGKLPAGNRIAWAVRQLRRGCLLARHGWRLDQSPKRLYLALEGKGETEVLSLQLEGRSELAKFARLSWVDVSAADWYVVNQLELAR
jgi:hypothetical protein